MGGGCAGPPDAELWLSVSGFHFVLQFLRDANLACHWKAFDGL